MGNIIETILISIGAGVLFAIPAMILGYWLKKIDTAPNRSLLSLGFCIVLTFVKQIWLPDLSYGWFALLVIAGSTLGIYRMDWYWASKKAKDGNNSRL